jgi:hypothetical protein
MLKMKPETPKKKETKRNYLLGDNLDHALNRVFDKIP